MAPSFQKSSNFMQALWLGVSNASSMLVSLISVAILSRYFDKAEYGTYKQIMFIYSTLLTVFQAGLPSVFSYFLPKYSHKEGKYIVSKINSALFILGALLSLSLFLLSEPISVFMNNPELSRGLKLFSPFPLFVLPTLGIEGIYIVNRNTRFIAAYNTVTRLIMLAFITLPVIFISNRYETAVLGWGVASLFAFLIALRYKTKPYADVKETVRVDGLFKRVTAYSLPILGSACVLLLYNSINQVFISRYFGAESFADYSNGYMPLPFISILVNPIRNMFIPLFSKAKSENTLDSTVDSFNRAIKELGLLIIPACIFSFIYARDIMVFIFGAQYESSYVFFRLAILYNIIEILPFQIPLSGMGKTKPLMVFDIAATIVLIGTNILLVQYDISTPFIIALSFTIMQILLRCIVPLIYTYQSGKIRILKRYTLLSLTAIFINCTAAGFVSYCITRITAQYTASPILTLLIAGCLFYALLLLSGKFLKIDYMSAFRRLISRK